MTKNGLLRTKEFVKSPYERLHFYHNNTFKHRLHKLKLGGYIHRNTLSQMALSIKINSRVWCDYLIFRTYDTFLSD